MRGDRDRDERGPNQQCHHRPSERDPQLRTRARKLPLELGHTPKKPKRDAVDLDAVATRLNSMPQLVQKKRAEEEERRHDRHQQVRAARETRILRREDAVVE